MLDSPERGIRAYAAPMILAIMVAVFFWPVLFTGRVFLIGDLNHIFYPGYLFLRENIARGALPLWNPYTGCGEPFLADIERQVFYPPNLIYLLLSTSRAMVLSACFHVLLAAWGTYGLCRLWGVSRLGSLLAAVLYAFNSYTITKIQFPSELSSACWFPVTLGAFVFWLRLRNRRRFLLLTVAVAFHCLAGFPETLFFAMGVTGAYALVVGYGEWRIHREWRRLLIPALGLLAAGLVAVLLSMAQLLPTWEALRMSPRSEKTDPRLGENSVHPMGIFSMLVPSVYGVQVQKCPGAYWAPSSHDYSVVTFYMGVVPIVLFIALGFRGRTNGRHRSSQTAAPDHSDSLPALFLLIIATVFLLYSMGKYTPFFGLCHRAIPFLQWSVSPPKCLLCVMLPLSCLAGFVMDRLSLAADSCPKTSLRWRRILAGWGTIGVFAGVALFMAVCLIRHGEVGTAILKACFNLGAVNPRFAHWIPWDTLVRDSLKLPIVGLCTAVLLRTYALGPRARNASASLILLGSFADLLVTNQYLIHPGQAELLETKSACLHQLRPEGKPIRFLSFDFAVQEEARKLLRSLPEGKAYEALKSTEVQAVTPQDWGRLVRLARDILHLSWPMADEGFNATSSNNFASQDVVRLSRLLLATHVPAAAKHRLLAMLNCDRIILLPSLEKLFGAEAPEPTRLALYGTPMPRAYLVGGVKVLTDPDKVLISMVTQPLEPFEVALTDAEAACGDTFDDLRPGRILHHVTRLEYVPNGVEIEVETRKPGLLVVTDAFYPGWSATVNGKGARIYKVNYAFRGVRVPAGTSLVTMTYRPASLRIGMGVSLISLIVVVVLAITSRSGSRRPTA